MSLLEAILLGIIQGLTEFLPISSSAHLRISSELMGIGDVGSAFTAITQIGTELAVVVFFWRDITRIIGRWFRSLTGAIPRRDPDAMLGWWIIVGTVPIVVLGLLFEDAIDSTLRSLWFVAIALIVFGLLLGYVDRIASQKREMNDLTGPHAVIYGFAQALALIPGVSRSGGTITAGLLMGYSRVAAARYSFLLAIPAIFGSGLYKLIRSVGDPSQGAALIPTAVATVVAFLAALVVISFFMRYISKRSFLPFVIYRVLLGIVIIVLLSTGVVSAEGGAAVDAAPADHPTVGGAW